jgi:hypothetical protein
MTLMTLTRLFFTTHRLQPIKRDQVTLGLLTDMSVGRVRIRIGMPGGLTVLARSHLYYFKIYTVEPGIFGWFVLITIYIRELEMLTN